MKTLNKNKKTTIPKLLDVISDVSKSFGRTVTFLASVATIITLIIQITS